MDFIMTLLVTIMVPILYIFPNRIISMTYNTFSRSITIKSNKWAALLIAEKNIWGIKTDSGKRNKMSIWGLIGYMVFLPQIGFLPYYWWRFMRTGSGQWFEVEQSYLWTVMLYYAVGLAVKTKEAIKFSKGEIW